MKRKPVKQLLSLALSLALLCSVLTAIPGSTASADSYADQLASAKAKASELEDEIESLKDQQSEKEALKKKLNEQIANTQDQIALVNSQIASLNSELNALQVELDAKNEELEAKKTLFKQRLRAMYMSSSSNSDILVLLGSDDVADYLAKSELTRSVSQQDEILMEEIVEAVQLIEADQAAIQTKKSAKQAAKKELSATQSSLQSQVAQLNSVISSLEDQQADAEAQLDKYNAAVASVEAQIAAASKAASQSTQNNASGTSVNSAPFSGGFVWPVPGYYGITSGYGYRWGKLHKGIDISSSGIAGAQIVAAASGTVSYAGYNAGGYGNYVIISHGTSGGNSFATLYGHMSKYIVSSGQHVSQGQVIGYVGNTGYVVSSGGGGYHLHFEISVNGSVVNPASYF